ncbi:MAG TPA: D-2-hydroxyacid dehydrogenase [Bryobacteraceae bacterium]|jgi:phosphoglycerate dehydrogenase-like enzyme|nr:D-2-hydroxyacid dehydrogenase [Bryobacteraceae bacterium]
MSAITLLVTGDPQAEYLKALDRLPPGTRVIASSDPAKLAEVAPEADVILNGEFKDPQLFKSTFPLATRVRWVHTLSAGVEHVLSPEIIASPVPMTNGRGVFRRPLAEWAVGAMLYFLYDFRRLVRQQEAGVWADFDIEELGDKTIGIVGYGEIGRAVAERAKPFGCKILALRRKPEKSVGDPLIDRAYAPSHIDEMLAACDFVVAAAPSTRETRGLIGPAQIAALKPSAVVINIGRGPVIDEPALIAGLESKKIRGAALDVFTVEPLPEGHPFYKMQNVLLSPHSADHTAGWRDRAVQFFLENFARFAKGEPLENVVDKHAGY